MTNLLGLEFIKFFHESTKHLAHEGDRLLHVDCHSSHINLDLLKFAVDKKIIVLGYPPHTTHLTQGLDVVMFAPFKNAFAKHALAHYKATKKDVDKPSFLHFLHLAVQESFHQHNILTAWRKTGLRPVNRHAISDLDLAPSREYSTIHALPLPPPSPIKAIVDAIHRQNRLRDEPPSPTSACAPLPHIPPSNEPQIDAEIDLLSAQVQSLNLEAQSDGPVTPPSEPLSPEDTHATNVAGEILRSLATTSMAPLLEVETITSACQLPAVERQQLPTQLVHILKRHNGMPNESLWNEVKHSLITVVPFAERSLAQNILSETYCQQLQRRLASKETERKKTPLQMVAGMKGGLIFTSDDVVELLAKDTETREKARASTEQKKAQKELLVEAEKWMESALEVQKEQHQRLVEAWEATPLPRARRTPPPKPPLGPIPDRYKEALAKKKGGQRKGGRARKVADDDSFSDSDSD